MADKELRPSGVVEPKGTAWLKEVRLDAARNTVENLRQSAEKQQFEAAKARGITVDEIISKGQNDLAKADPDFAENTGTAPVSAAGNAASQTSTDQNEVEEKAKTESKKSK